MGVFWPLDNTAHVARLVGLLGLVAGVCAISDRETRYSLLRLLYSQLKQLDEGAARQIEREVEDKIAADAAGGGSRSKDYNNARDTRSFASDSTAFSRATSPHPEHVYLNPDARTQPSSALCNTPEAVSQLGEALSRLAVKNSSKHLLPSTPEEGKQPSPPRKVGVNYNLAVQENAVTPGEADVLLPLTTVAPAFPPPQVAREASLSKAGAADAEKRLCPLPNPSAPKIKPTMKGGKPQLFDYTPPVSVPPTPPLQVMAEHKRRVRGHVEIETTDHDSYGFVSNPAALVPPVQPASAAQTENPQAQGAEGDHYLFVCIKCQRRNTSEVCETVCSDENGVLRCKLKPRNGLVMDDMEDLVMPMTPRIYTDGRRKTTGRMLYENLQALHSQHERMKSRAACHGAGPHTHHSGEQSEDGTPSSSSRECPNAVRSRLRIVPVNCLSMCHLANVVAVTAPGKFGYQFGAMREDDSEDMQAILQFAEDYIESDEGFTKNKTRPPRLSRNILSRIPPALPSFTSIAE